MCFIIKNSKIKKFLLSVINALINSLFSSSKWMHKMPSLSLGISSWFCLRIHAADGWLATTKCLNFFGKTENWYNYNRKTNSGLGHIFLNYNFSFFSWTIGIMFKFLIINFVFKILLIFFLILNIIFLIGKIYKKINFYYF